MKCFVLIFSFLITLNLAAQCNDSLVRKNLADIEKTKFISKKVDLSKSEKSFLDSIFDKQYSFKRLKTKFFDRPTRKIICYAKNERFTFVYYKKRTKRENYSLLVFDNEFKVCFFKYVAGGINAKDDFISKSCSLQFYDAVKDWY